MSTPSQPAAGSMDVMASLAALECIAALDDAGIRTRRPLEVAAWTNEEGTRFQPGAKGSGAFVDPALIDALSAQVIDGIADRSARRASRRISVTLCFALRGRRRMPSSRLHIEQGPLLELAGVPLGVVTGIQGVRWYSVRCKVPRPTLARHQTGMRATTP